MNIVRGGKKRDDVWHYFDKIPRGTGYRAICKKCKKGMQPALPRMKKHVEVCQPTQIYNLAKDILDKPEHSSSLPSTSASKQYSPATATSNDLPSHLKQVSKTEKMALDKVIASFIYATNTPFQTVEHGQFIKMIRKLRPGYTPPNKEQIEGHLLDQSFSSVIEAYSKELKGKTVCMAMDGWRNIYNEAVLPLTLSVEGKMYFVDCVDTPGYTADYLMEIAKFNADKVKEKFGCTVRSFVIDHVVEIDHVSHMAKMRKEFGIGKEIITYGCSAHLLNLFSHDMQITSITEPITEIINYFGDHGIAGSLYKAAGGTMLEMPVETHWNMIANSIESYLKNWDILVKVCKDNSEIIDQEIIKKVCDENLKRATEDYLERMKPIAVALNSVQKETTLISDAVEIWLKLKEDMKEALIVKADKHNFEKRMSVALTPAHYLSYMIDPRYQGWRMTSEQRSIAEKYVSECFPTFVATLMSFRGRSPPFKDFYFAGDVLETLTPLAWWLNFSSDLPANVMDVPRQFFTAVASSAGVERVFSTYGDVHSTIRNCLGKEKASKLVAIHKYYNK